MHSTAVTAKVQRYGIPGQRPKLRLGWLPVPIVIVVIIRGIDYQAVQQNYAIPTQLRFERTPDHSVLYRLTSTWCPLREGEIANMMNEVMLSTCGAGHERQAEQSLLVWPNLLRRQRQSCAGSLQRKSHHATRYTAHKCVNHRAQQRPPFALCRSTQSKPDKHFFFWYRPA
jgi:hypothetical protein